MNSALAPQRVALSGPAVAKSPRAARCAVPARKGRTCVQPLRADGDGDGFQRSPLQQSIKDADDAVNEAVQDFGKALNNAFMPIGTALGMGKGSAVKDEDGETAAPALKGWAAQAAYLKEAGLQSVTAEKAQELMGKGYVMVDCRPTNNYEDRHPAGSLSVPLVREIPGMTVRKALFMAQAVRPIEDNPDWAEELAAAAKDAQGVIFACGSGGTLTGTVNFPDGQSSRSLQAAHKALSDSVVGCEVLHLRGGLVTWIKEDLPSEGTGEWEDMIGKTPYVAGFSLDQDAEELM